MDMVKEEYQKKKSLQTVVGLSFAGFSIVFVTALLFLTILAATPAQATGGAGEIKGLIDPIIERAITALQQNNTDLALEEIQTLKQELDDTFSVDDKEEDEDDSDRNDKKKSKD